MCMMVWILLGYSCLTITLLAQTGGIPAYQSFIYTILVTMALSCHVKTTLTDPGSVPASAVPTEIQRNTNDKLAMCSQCQTFKPPLSHHCRICNRCVSKMDRKFIVCCLLALFALYVHSYHSPLNPDLHLFLTLVFHRSLSVDE